MLRQAIIALTLCLLLPPGSAQTSTTPEAPSQKAASSAPPLHPKLPTLFIVGDSNARSGADLGWGEDFAASIHTTRINIQKPAPAGRSSRTNTNEALWAETLIHSPVEGYRPAIAESSGASDRAYTITVMQRLADPLLNALADGRLHQQMPVEGSPDRGESSHLEALGRLLAGLAPWLELGPDDTPEGRLREHYILLSRRAIHQAVDPRGPDYMNFTTGNQRLVDAAFLAHALLRAPHQLWEGLATGDRTNLIAALKATRTVHPPDNNWTLFSAMIEAVLWNFTGQATPSEQATIQTAVEKHMAWYKGDGLYGDGASFHWDYYNSFVIQPMLLDIMTVCAHMHSPLAVHAPLILERARRYAQIQEELISPEATFPIIGRSSTYRFGAFQLLSQIALEHQLPASLDPGAVRAALTAVVRRMIEAPGTFDHNGWLQIGTVGHQPLRGEAYISTGSLYLCSAGLLHLGLPTDDPLWSFPARPWTQQRIWSGENLPADNAIAQ